MDKRFLEDCLDQGMSLERIGEEVGKHPSTVSYWLKKHGLNANGRQKYAPRGGIDWEVLEIMVEDGLSLAEMAEQLDRIIPTVRYWLKRYGLQSGGGLRRTASAAARREGLRETTMECPRHGLTFFVLESRGYYRCKRCRSDAVSKRRRVVKSALVKEAGGGCALCGYNRSPAALQFHHPDPSTKEFALSDSGISRSLARARTEAERCVLLCANCHAEVESGRVVLPIKFASHEQASDVT